ncbi:MAG: 1,4-alpha-glucan branching enzyme, partial [Solirubrobacterales bacterium]|nr:1,4-alpha-glucan branching enzyme [Solirubrobacterales bacterium]
MIATPADLDRLVDRRHSDPHSLLGAHPAKGGVVVRAWRPGAAGVSARVTGSAPVALEVVHPAGVFEVLLPGASLPLAYELEVDYGEHGTWTVRDPYSFLPTLGELDVHLAGEGRHEELYQHLGAHVREVDGIAGVAFALWAPAARSVSVVGDFNAWDGRLNPMRVLGPSGIWELFLPGAGPGSHYKFEVVTSDGEIRLKADPYAFA